MNDSRHKTAHGRFEKKIGGLCGLTVTDPNLDEQIRRLALRAMELGTTGAQKDATLRCLINHCEALRPALFPGTEPSHIFPIEEIKS
ncbi:hypothetical protein LCGC14_1274830 [marine sediment metagenome]|uniref:Uncharacterized protein n=1 Tax=marine sediment metagenome TaxID=412755 RepID=A0A0F9P059_9ZZZZ